ncbi:hypothetical protein SHIRM173S_04921 [Streptomyces hirsutus]
MSHNQPGPSGGRPSGPEPYGQPGPYGQQPQAPQPGYGYPPQAPPPGQPGYGYPPQPGQGVPPQQPPYGQAPYGAPQPPPPGGSSKAGWMIGAVAVVAAIGVGVYFVIGGGGGGGVEDDGPHKLSAPEKVMGEYTRVGEAGEDSSSGTTKDLAKGGVKNGKSVGAQYSTADFSRYDPTAPDPADIPGKEELLKAKGVILGAYGEVEDPEEVVDKFCANIAKETKENSSNELMTELLGKPEAVDLDGAVMESRRARATTTSPRRKPPTGSASGRTTARSPSSPPVTTPRTSRRKPPRTSPRSSATTCASRRRTSRVPAQRYVDVERAPVTRPGPFVVRGNGGAATPSSARPVRGRGRRAGSGSG